MSVSLHSWLAAATEQLKTEVEVLASREGLSLADFTRRAVLRDATARHREAARAAWRRHPWQADVRAYVCGGNERVAHQELTDASSEADVFN